MVVPLAAANLFVIGGDARADRVRLAKVERRSRHRRDLACRNLRFVGRRVAIGID